MRLQFNDNVYFAAPGQAWFKWGPTWALHKSYADLSEFQADLGLDTGGQTFDPGFADLRTLDFRLSADGAERLTRNCPGGPVPGVLLGAR